MHIEESVKMMISDKFFRDIVDAAASQNGTLALHFGTEMRKHFVQSVLQDIKSFIEAKSGGLVEVSYEDYSLKGHEFGFKLHVVRGDECCKQMYFDASAAAVNIVNYMFRGDNEQYDIAIAAEDNALEVSFVSNW